MSTVIIGLFFFWLGGLIGIFLGVWLRKRKDYDGVVVITGDHEKALYSIELAEDPRMLVFEREILLKVDTTGLDTSLESVRE